MRRRALRVRADGNTDGVKLVYLVKGFAGHRLTRRSPDATIGAYTASAALGFPGGREKEEAEA